MEGRPDPKRGRRLLPKLDRHFPRGRAARRWRLRNGRGKDESEGERGECEGASRVSEGESRVRGRVSRV